MLRCGCPAGVAAAPLDLHYCPCRRSPAVGGLLRRALTRQTLGCVARRWFCWRCALWLSRPVFPRLLRSVPPAVSYRALSLTLAASSRLAGRPTGLFSRRRACRWGWEATPAPVVWRRLPYRFPDSLSQRPSPTLSDCALFAGDCWSGDGAIEGYPPPASLAATAY